MKIKSVKLFSIWLRIPEEAISDTIAKDCDYNTLFRVYAQMASIYHKQLLLSNEIETRKQTYHYALLAKDTLNAIFALDKKKHI